MKAQASMEQLIVIGVALAFVAIAFYFASSYSSDSVKIAQSEDAVGRLAAGADYVYSLGPNSKEYVTVYLPQDIQATDINGSRILFRLRTSSGITDVFANSKAELIGSLPSYRGKQKILIQYLPSGKVSIGEAGLICTPSTLIASINGSGQGPIVLTVTNVADYRVTGLTASTSGAAAQFLYITSFGPGELDPEGNAVALGSYNVPPGTASGIYGGAVDIESANDGSCSMQVTLHVTGAETCGGQCTTLGYTSGVCVETPGTCIFSGGDHRPEFDDTCTVPPDSLCCCSPTQDVLGPLATNLAVANTSGGGQNPFQVSSTWARMYYQCDVFVPQLGFSAALLNTESSEVQLTGVQVNGTGFGFCETGQMMGTITFNAFESKSVEIFDPEGIGYCQYNGQQFSASVTFQHGGESQTQELVFVCIDEP